MGIPPKVNLHRLKSLFQRESSQKEESGSDFVRKVAAYKQYLTHSGRSLYRLTRRYEKGTKTEEAVKAEARRMYVEYHDTLREYSDQVIKAGDASPRISIRQGVENAFYNAKTGNIERGRQDYRRRWRGGGFNRESTTLSIGRISPGGGFSCSSITSAVILDSHAESRFSFEPISGSVLNLSAGISQSDAHER